MSDRTLYEVTLTTDPEGNLLLADIDLVEPCKHGNYAPHPVLRERDNTNCYQAHALNQLCDGKPKADE